MNSVERVTLGRTGLTISRLGLGTWGFGPASPPQSQVGSDEELVNVLRRAFAAGINYIDSAEVYENEARLGRLLRDSAPPADLVVVSKYGHGKGFDSDGVRRSAERSLDDLGLEQLPLMLIHDPRTPEHMDEVLGRGGALQGLRRLQDEGLVASIGVATGTLRPLQLAVQSGEFDCIQFPRLHTLLTQAARTSGLLDAARDAGMGTLLAAPFGGNILATGTIPGALYTYREPLPEVLDAVRRMEARCAELGVSIAAAALTFPLSDPGIDGVVLGVTSAEQLDANLTALASPLSREELVSIAAAADITDDLVGGPEFLNSWPAGREPERKWA